MSFFSDIGLLYAFSVILGGLILVAFTIGLARLFWMKRRLARNKTARDIETAEKVGKELLNQNELGEGDLFGIRALEKGFYGGVAQSQSTTATNSTRSWPSSLVDSDGNSTTCSSSTGISAWAASIPQGTSQNGSITRDAPAMGIRLQPSEIESMGRGRRNHDPSDIVGDCIANLTAESGSPATAQVHPELASRTSRPFSIVQTNQARPYNQSRLPTQETIFRSIPRIGSTKNRWRDMNRFHASSGENYPGPSRQKIRSIPTKQYLGRILDSTADTSLEVSARSRYRTSQRGTIRCGPSRKHEGAAKLVLRRNIDYHVPTRIPVRKHKNSPENAPHATNPQLKVKIAICPGNGATALVKNRSRVPGNNRMKMGSAAAATASFNESRI